MKRIAILVGILVCCAAAAAGQDGLFKPMKGSATPEFETSDETGYRCLVFGTHIVKTIQSEDGGENIQMWHREGTTKGMDACELRAKPYANIKDSDNNSFFGISAVYTFIDMGTSAGSRSLYVIKTDSGDEVTTVGYYGGGAEPRIESARYLFYDAVSNKKGTVCPETVKWKRQGGGVAWVQGKKMDLQTLAATNVGGLRCAYME